MTRQNIYPDTEHRLFEAYMDFSGGLNTEISNEKLKSNEYVIMQNVDLLGHGSAKRRTGRTSILTQAGTTQGMFFFFVPGETTPRVLMAISGKLYSVLNGVATQINITDGGSAWTFQATLPIEAVQYKGYMFVATGSKLVEVTYSGGNFSAVTTTPYTPTVQEAIYIGTNGLSPNPSTYIQDGTASSLSVVGIQPNKRKAAININMAMTAYIAKPAGMANVDYMWEYKKSSDATWVSGMVWTTGTPGKTWNFNVSSAGSWDIRVSVRDTSTPATTAAYVLSGYQVTPTDETVFTSLDTSNIQTCRKIMLHWDRILLYGDSINGSQMYISDLQNPRYYPVPNSINYDIGKAEAITTAIRFQDMLVIFSPTTIQTLTGKDPSTYARYLIQDGIGCIAARSAVVVGNEVMFKSYEGVQALRPNPYRIETMNVRRIDFQIKSEIPNDTDACAMLYNNQYWLCFPQKSMIYRFYFEANVWVKDVSTKLNITQFQHYGTAIYNLTADGNLYQHSDSVFNDCGEIYSMITETKLLDLGASFNNKKLRRVYVIAKHFTKTVNIFVRVKADSTFVLTPDGGTVTVGADGYTTWKSTTAPNMHFYAGTSLGNWILGSAPLGDVQLSVQRASIHGKCRRIKVNFTHTEDLPCEIYGFGVEFKLKKP